MVDKEQARAANRLESVYQDLTTFRLHGQGVERSGPCPFHEDEHPSFSINIDKQVWHCHGCDIGGDVFSFVERIRNASFEEALEWLANRAGLSSQEPAAVVRYDYRDEQRTLLFFIKRSAGKRFTAHQPDGTPGMDGTRRVLYRFPELLGANRDDIVFIPEGEKDVDRLRAGGLVATTNPFGAGKWLPGFNGPLRGRNVVVLADNDDKGRQHANEVARALDGTAAKVKVLHLPGVPEKGDVSDWLDAGHDAVELVGLAEAAPEFSGAESSNPAVIENRVNRETSGLKLTRVGELLSEAPENIRWLVDELLPTSGLSILAAKPKVGKSTLGRNLAVAVARGSEFLGLPTTPGPVLYFALEEKRAEIRHHFQRMGVTDEPIYVHVGAAPQDAFRVIENLIDQHKPVLVIVDPLSRILRLADWNDYGKVTKAMEPLVDLARNTASHIMCLHHLNKAREIIDLDAMNGSIGFSGAIDTGLLTVRHENDRAITSVNRYGKELPPTRLVLDGDTGIITAAGPVSIDPEARRAEDIVRLMSDAKPRTEDDIKQALRGNQTVTAKAIRALRASEVLVVEGDGRRNSPFIYRLATPC
jgi:putative DNA primase/helicase